MKTIKRNSSSAFAIFALAIIMSTLPHQSKKDKKFKKSNNSAFVFTTPKLLSVGFAIDKHFLCL